MTDTLESRSSRRVLLAGAAGAVAAWIANAVGRAGPVHAEDEAIVVGGEYTDATSVTKIKNSTGDAGVFAAESAGYGTAITAISANYLGLYAESSSYDAIWAIADGGVGLDARSETNVALTARTNAPGLPAIVANGDNGAVGLAGYSGGITTTGMTKAGVFGEAFQDSSSRGVWGKAHSGRGVFGQATSGVGLYGQASTGFALRTDGRISFDKVSGVASIAAGNKTKTVSPGVDVTASSFVLLTPKVNIGSRVLWYTTDAAANTITIHMSSTRSSSTPVAWLLMG